MDFTQLKHGIPESALGKTKQAKPEKAEPQEEQKEQPAEIVLPSGMRVIIKK